MKISSDARNCLLSEIVCHKLSMEIFHVILNRLDYIDSAMTDSDYILYQKKIYRNFHVINIPISLDKGFRYY